MHSFSGTGADPRYHCKPDWIHPALIHFADECSATFARLMAYVGSLALLAIVGVHLWAQLPDPDRLGPAAEASWTQAARSIPAFAVSQPELIGKTETYDILRHPDGGRKDVIRWAAAGEKPVAELEIYRPGGEAGQSWSALAELGSRIDPGDGHAPETAGVIDSKFGPVTLLRLAGVTADQPGCLGFMQRFGDPDLRISGWSCQGDSLSARRVAIGCILNRLTLLAAGNDPKLAELFARAELRRGSCAATGPAAPAAWVTEADNPRLRGAL